MQWPQTWLFTLISTRTCSMWICKLDIRDISVWTGRAQRALTGAEAFNCPDDDGAQHQGLGCIFSFPVLYCLINLFTFSPPVCSPHLAVCFFP